MKLKKYILVNTSESEKNNRLLTIIRNEMKNPLWIKNILNNSKGFIDFINKNHSTSKFTVEVQNLDEIDKGAINLIFEYNLLISFRKSCQRISIICKRYLPFFKKNTGIKILEKTSVRGFSEYKFAQIFESRLKKFRKVSVIPIISYESEKNILIQSKIGDKYKICMDEDIDPSLHIHISSILGRAIATIHSRLDSSDRKLERPILRGNQLMFNSKYLSLFLKNDIFQKEFKKFVECTKNNPRVLIHGDLSPKNVFVNEKGGVVLFDFEESNYDDPCVDISRWLGNYAVLSLYRREGKKYIQSIRAFINSYQQTIESSNTQWDVKKLLDFSIKYVGIFLIYRSETLKFVNIPESRPLTTLLVHLGKKCFLSNSHSIGKFFQLLNCHMSNS